MNKNSGDKKTETRNPEFSCEFCYYGIKVKSGTDGHVCCFIDKLKAISDTPSDRIPHGVRCVPRDAVMNTKLFRVGMALLAGVLVCSLPFTARAQQVRANWSNQAPFATYKTYQWIPSEATNHPFYRQYVNEYVNYALTQKKHLQEVSASQNPDLLVTYHFSTRQVMDYTTYGYGYGYGFYPGWGWGGGWGGPGYYSTQAQPRVMGYLVLDLIDAKTRQIVWRGEAIQSDVTKSGNAEEKQVADSVYKMLKRYPPPPAKDYRK